MKITKEEFYKLSQLDRIEYRQRRKNIEKDYSVSMFSLIWQIVIINTFVFIVDIWLNIRFDITLPIDLFKTLIRIEYIALFAAVFLDLIVAIIYFIRISKLNKEYFKILKK